MKLAQVFTNRAIDKEFTRLEKDVKKTAQNNNPISIITNLISSKLSLNKRKKIIIATMILTFGLIATTHTNLFIFLQFRIILGLAILAVLLTLWALWEGMNKTKAFVLLILPVLYMIAVPSLYIAGQQVWQIRWLTRVPAAILFGLSFYCLLLSQNVFNVASMRTIPLYRAASTASFVFSILTASLLYQVVRVFELPFYLNGIAVFAISFLIILQALWTVRMEEKIPAKLLIYSFILALILAEYAIVLSFWPIAKFSLMWGVSLSAALFIVLGLAIDKLRDRLFGREVALYLGFGFLAVLFLFFTTSWTG